MTDTAPPDVPPDQAVLAATRRLIWSLGLPVLGLLAVLTALQYRQRMEEAEQSLQLRLAQHALDLEQLVRPAINHVHDLRALLVERWNDPPDPGPEVRQALGARLQQGRPDGVTMDRATAAQRQRYGQIWWAAPDGSGPPEDWLRRAVSFVEQARVAHERAPGFEATWFAGTDTNGSFGYPWIASERIVAAMGTDGLVAMAPVRAEATEVSRRKLAEKPPRTTWWGAPDISQLQGHLVISHGAMVIVNGAYVGEVSVDFRIDDLQQRVAAWAGAAPGRYWIVNDRQNVLADSAQPLLPAAGARWTPSAQDKLQLALAEHLPRELAPATVQRVLQQPGRLLHEQGWLLSAARREAVPWTTLVAVPESALRAAVLSSLVPNALIALALLLMFVAGQWMLSRHFVAPALRILAYLRALSVDPRVEPPRLEPRWRVWVDAVTDVFRSQRELQQREHLLRQQQHQREAFNAAIVQWALAAIVATDARGNIVEFNPAAEAMFGRPRAQMLGQRIAQLFPERYRQRHIDGLAQLVAGERSDFLGRRVEMVACRGDGSEFPVELLLWRTEHDGEIHFTASMVDLTERRQAQHEIERQREALRQSEKIGAMGGLLAGVAHELNNPLAVVMGRAGLLEEKLDDPALRADAARIREAAERCGRIVRTFLNMARSKPAQRGAVMLNDLVRAAADMLGYVWRSHGIELRLELADGLPPVDADGDQIGQVVLNLLVNAQQALAGVEGPRCVTVRSGLQPAREGRAAQCWLQVQDNGPGVPAAARAQIFEPFFTTKAEGMGTGLGLAVSRSLARAHGGELLLEDSSDGGASFRLQLPVAGSPAAAAAEPDPAPDTPALARVLVVDDEADIANLVREMLESAGYEVATAESGAVALELLDAARFDAIVSDLRMPDMDGAALWREVRRRHPALARKMLFVTGDTLSVDARQFLDEARCASLDKPFTKPALLRGVAALLQDSGEAQAASEAGDSV
ncbi:ATP-binding protein [Aquabacterium sp.]|uniref:hybrid sensor histidine kinase/response regulator n=1 Tax=Aquabacterium sp. TaxID=1872578 RepID=UPI0037847364